MSAHVCHACDEVITDPADADLVAHVLGNSGPGWEVYARRDHVDDVGMIDPDLLRSMTRIWDVKIAARACRQMIFGGGSWTSDTSP
ncbi:hypothetical protein OG729_01545 [Streptomyces sp. NBC_00210]|uniref:hypothetical protein n=1 Tax=Streptomyces sp. NBC_00210 TaxID=2903636 RepID=UPI0032537561